MVIATMTAAVVVVIPERYKNALVERFTSKDEEVYMDRLYFLWNALGAFSEHPMLGIGLGTYEIRSWEFMQKYPVPWRKYRWSVAEQWNMPESVPVHNEYGRMLAEQGAFSVPAFLFLFAMAFRNLYAAYRRSRSPLVQLWATAMSMYLAALGVYFYFHEYFMEEPYIAIIPFALSIILYNHVRRAEAERADVPAA
jgi:O-antigen ligase